MRACRSIRDFTLPLRGVKCSLVESVALGWWDPSAVLLDLWPPSPSVHLAPTAQCPEKKQVKAELYNSEKVLIPMKCLL